MEKTKLGYDKVHDQLLKREKVKEFKAAKQKAKIPQRVMRSESRSTTEDKQTITAKDDQLRPQTYKDRLLPNVSTKPTLPTENISNKTDDDKLYVDRIDETFVKKFAVIERQEKKTVKTNTIPYSPDQTKIDGPDQCGDFYSYTVEELVDCLNLCGLKRLAMECNTHRLDGEFFRKFDLNELKNEPFSLNRIELLKVRKVIENGWRPK